MDGELKGHWKQVTVEAGQQHSPAAQRLRQRGVSLQIGPEGPRVCQSDADYGATKERLHIAAARGDSFHSCASMSDAYICCRAHVLESVSNCPYDCSYCFLQGYLTDATTWAVGDVTPLLEEVARKTALEPERLFRIGTWELGDSLALEPWVGTGADLVQAFATWPNAIVELKTKSQHIHDLLPLAHGGHTVVSWTLTPSAVAQAEERGAATVAQRLAAMQRVARAGYLVGLHFDPMILHAGWQAAYEELVRSVAEAVPAEQVAWISIGALRFHPAMKHLVEARFATSRITSAEMVLGDDRKVRYVKPLRMAMYEHLYGLLGEHGLASASFVYLCMERWDVWQKLFGSSPESSSQLDQMLTDSLIRRYPGLRPRPAGA